MRSPQVFDRPLRGPVSGDQIVVRLRFGASRRRQLVQRVDREASRAQDLDPLPMTGLSASLTWLTAERVNRAGR